MHRQLMPLGPGQEVIFRVHDRQDYRRENLKVVSKVEARRHPRVRRDSESGVKSGLYDPASDSWKAFVCWHGHQ
jgi:hypothetical protein